MPGVYRYALGQHTAAPNWGFEPRSASLTFYLSGQAHECTFTIDAESPAGLNITELSDDVWVWRNGVPIFRGPVTNIEDTMDKDEHTLSVTANSYRYRLQRLYTNLQDVFASGSYLLNGGTPSIAPNLAWDLIHAHLGSSSASGQTDLFSYVRQGAVTSPAASNITGSVANGTAIADAIDALAQAQAFDWDMTTTGDGNVYFTCWQPGRGSARPDTAFVYIRGGAGSNCTIQRTLDVSEYANRVYVNGANTSGTQFIASAQASWQTPGRYTWIEDGTDLDVSQLQARANQLLLEKQTPTPSYTITPVEGFWLGPDTLWLGDQPKIMIRSGRLSDDTNTLSINQINLAPADGNDNFSFTAGAAPFGQYGEEKLARNMIDMSKRIRALSWSRTSRGV